jgi:hypothetical protein
LGVWQKKVYIAAFAVINLQHHCSRAAEGPMINNQCFRIDLANEIARYAE